MKKLKLRMWVKVGLLLIVMGMLICFLENQENKAVSQCVNAGHSQTYCENGLK